MALRKSSGGTLLKASKARKARGSGLGSSLPASGSSLYDYTYRQNSDDYDQGIMSYDDYISFLQNKLSGLTEGTNDYLTIDKRIRSVTGAYNKKNTDLATSQITTDYQNGLVGFATYSKFLSDKLATLDPNSMEYFSTQKTLDTITEQQTDKQMDYGFKTAKTIEPDDYIKWKQDLLAKTDPSSSVYTQLETDIQSASWEKVNRSEQEIKFDVLEQTKNKQDLAKFYMDTAKATTDPQKQMEYYTKYSETVDSINADALKTYNDQLSLQDRDMDLKYRRGDLGKTWEENAQAYYDYLNDRYANEMDPNKQISIASQMDAVVKSVQDGEEQQSKKAQAGGEKAASDSYKSIKNDYYDKKEILEKGLNNGSINADQYATEMTNLTNTYIQDMYSVGGNPYLSDSLHDSVNSEIEKINTAYESDSFWKSNKMIVDADNKPTGQVWHDPNYKAVQEIDDQGNMKTSWKFDPTQDYKMDGYVWDESTKVWRKAVKVNVKDANGNDVKDAQGKNVTREEIYRTDKDGNIVVEYQDPDTGDWGSLGDDGTFKKSANNYSDADLHAIKNQDQLNEYQAEQSKKYWDQYDKQAGTGIGAKIAKASVQNPLVNAAFNASENFNKWGYDALSGVGKSVVDLSNSIYATPGKIKNTVGAVENKLSSDFNAKTLSELPTDINTIKKWAIGTTGKEVSDLQKALKDNGLIKSVSGYYGPATQAAVEKYNQIATQISSDFNAKTLNKLPQDVNTVANYAENYIAGGVKSVENGLGNIYNSITNTAKNYVMPNTNSIGGALGIVYNNRPDLQQAFDANGQGKGEWAGKNINDWASMYGYKEDASLATYAPKPAPTISLPSLKNTVKTTVNNVVKTASDVYNYNPVVNTIKNDVNAVTKTANDVYNYNPTVNAIKNTAGAVSNSINNTINSAKTAASNFISKLW